MDIKGQLTNPHGMVLVWNYKDRGTSSGTKQPNKVEQVIISTASLKSMSTQKLKSRPDGSFEFRLAPTFNWVARITPGSWCALLMAKDQAMFPTSPSLVPPATRETLKMLGRIHSVRAVITVDTNGTRNTEYVVTGQDWGSIFNSHLYIDPIAKNNNLEKLPAVGHAAFLYLEDMLKKWTDGDQLPGPSDVVEGIIKMWGNPIPDIAGAFKGAGLSPHPTITSQAQFQLPLEVMAYLKQPIPPDPKFTPMFAGLITLKDGVLIGKDKYKSVDKEALGFPNPDSFYGTNSFWQLMVANSNPAISEMLTDFSWSGTGIQSKPTFALYRRIKPFITQKFQGSSYTKKFISKFQNIRTVDIALEDVINIHAGTNWRDKVNFVEIRPQQQRNEQNYDVAVKLQNQTTDLLSIERDGFKPIIQKVDYIPYDVGGNPSPLVAAEWKWLIREWYFNTHNMLNGAMMIIGQNEYIGVGDNIRVPIKVLGDSYFNAGQLKKSADNVYLLAHVESVSNNFSVDGNGARTFSTTIEFSRGIVVDDNGTPLAVSSNGTLDQDARALPGKNEKLQNTFGTSTENDPDLDKIRGT